MLQCLTQSIGSGIEPGPCPVGWIPNTENVNVKPGLCICLWDWFRFKSQQSLALDSNSCGLQQEALLFIDRLFYGCQNCIALNFVIFSTNKLHCVSSSSNLCIKLSDLSGYMSSFSHSKKQQSSFYKANKKKTGNYR